MSLFVQAYLDAKLASPAERPKIFSENPLHVMEQAFFEAARRRDGETALKLIHWGLDPNAGDRNEDEWPLLCGAASMNLAEVVRELVARGADVNTRRNGCSPPLSEAAYSGAVEAAQTLLSVGEHEATVVLDACNVAFKRRHGFMIDLFLPHLAPEHKAEVEARHAPDTRYRSWHAEREIAEDTFRNAVQAIATEDTDTLTRLLNLGMSPDATWSQDSLLSVAIRKEKTDAALRLIEHGATVEVHSNSHLTYLCEAISMRLLEVARALIAAGANPNRGGAISSPLNLAVKRGLPELVPDLIQAGATSSALSSSGLETLVMTATKAKERIESSEQTSE